MKLRTGDTVVIISGKDKGKSGAIMRVMPEEGRIVVAGINMRTRHIKKTFQEAGRILKYEAAISSSNVMIIDPKTQKPSRIGYKMEKGKKLRISKASGEVVVKAKVKREAKKTEAKKEMKDGETASEAKKKAAPGMPVAQTGADKKQPFWKRMKFGAAAMEQAETPEQANMEKDRTIPSQEIHVRKGARGS